LYFNFKINILD